MAASYASALTLQARVIWALMLRDTRTRFGRTFFGYLFIIGRPLGHLLLILTIFLVVRGRVPLMGTSSVIFWGTGLLPYILFFYPSLMMMQALTTNRPLLYFPIVKTFDVILARGLLEILTSFWVCLVFIVILTLFEVDFMPIDPWEAVMAILATIYLGFAFGWFGSVVRKIMPAWMFIQVGLKICMYFTSGVFFIPMFLPEWMRNILWYNPLLHAVEWTRSAFYEGYGEGMLSVPYLLGFATGLLFVGMSLERLVRGLMLQR